MRAFCLFVCFWWDYRIVDFTISTKGNVPAPLGSLNQILVVVCFLRCVLTALLVTTRPLPTHKTTGV